ncbi:hypothetical protein ACMX2H_09560 [Arthrobacter sulfonylureivorans]|uniref:hypothetical protein n=1 Tax=Arthrobacter sulfonylureivorans TaxID=2486855 RepID=UPI0039E67E7B
MTTTPANQQTPPDTADVLEAQLAQLVQAISEPENQGEAMTARDYVALLLVTLAIPAIMILIGSLL